MKFMHASSLRLGFQKKIKNKKIHKKLKGKKKKERPIGYKGLSVFISKSITQPPILSIFLYLLKNLEFGQISANVIPATII